MSKFISLVIIAFLVGGCSFKEVEKPIKKYTIYNNVEAVDKKFHIEKIIKVANLKAPNFLQNNTIWFENSSLEINPYLYATWNENFSDIIEQNIVNTLYNSNLFKSVYSKYSKIGSDMILESELILASHLVEDNAIQFVVRLYLIDKEKDVLLDSKEFRYKQKCESFDIKGAVFAYNKIIKQFDDDMVKWIGNINATKY